MCISCFYHRVLRGCVSAGGLLLGLLALYLIKSKPHAMVGAAVGLQVRRGGWAGTPGGSRSDRLNQHAALSSDVTPS
jgi:hypothetical protein